MLNGNNGACLEFFRNLIVRFSIVPSLKGTTTDLNAVCNERTTHEGNTTMITWTKFPRRGLLTMLVLSACTAAHGQLLQDLSDLNPTNPDSGVREGLRDID